MAPKSFWIVPTDASLHRCVTSGLTCYRGAEPPNPEKGCAPWGSAGLGWGAQEGAWEGARGGAWEGARGSAFWCSKRRMSSFPSTLPRTSPSTLPRTFQNPQPLVFSQRHCRYKWEAYCGQIILKRSRTAVQRGGVLWRFPFFKTLCTGWGFRNSAQLRPGRYPPGKSPAQRAQ